MGTDYLDMSGYDGVGFTISPEFFSEEQENGFFQNMPDDFDFENTEIILQASSNFTQPRPDDVTESMVESFEEPQTPSMITSGHISAGSYSVFEAHGCPVYCTVIFVTLTITGMIASFMAFADTIVRRKKRRHRHNFLHIFASSVLILLPFPFAGVSRFGGQWKFGEEWFKILSVVTSAAQTTCALQLAYLTQIRCREVIWLRETVTNFWNKIVCWSIWLISFAAAWPCGIFESVLSDVIKAKLISQKRSSGATLYIKVNTAVSFIFPALVSAGCFVVALIYKTQNAKEKNKKVWLRILRGVKEVAILSLAFFLCWLPYRAWRIITLELTTIPSCGVLPDVFLLIGLAVTVLMPIFHFNLSVNQAQSSQKDSGISKTRGDAIPMDDKDNHQAITAVKALDMECLE